MSDAQAPPAPVRTREEALPHGTRFAEFEIIRVLGVGGFGVVYLANDYSLERQVALKEYMPASLAVRGEGALITVRSESLAETYSIGLRSFINEARLLARFDHPSLVKVYRFWEDNGTAYMVMPYLQGTTLRDTRRQMSAPPIEAWIRGVLAPMLDALEQLHLEGVYHRDVAPDNILLPRNGAPVLLDFGAARRVISDRTQSLTAILKPSYAPIEQYAEMTGMRQGPWTDIYALGAVMHFLLFGAPPAPSTARAVQDDAEAIEDRVVAGVSPHFMQLVAWMLGVRPQDRPQSVEAVRAALRGDAEITLPPRREPARTVTQAPPSGTSTAFPPTEVDAAYAPTQRAAGAYSQPTRLDTAHQPTRLDTAHQPTQLGTAYQPTLQDTPHQPTLAVPSPAPPIVAVTAAPAAAQLAPSKPPAAAAVPLTAPAAKTSSRKGPIIAGLVVAAAAVAMAGWQFSARAPAAAPTAAAAPPQAAPIVATPDVGPSIAQVASVPQWGNGPTPPKPPAR